MSVFERYLTVWVGFAKAKLTFDLDRLALPKDATITNQAVLLPGVDEAQIGASLQFAGGAAVPLQISNGLALSNGGPLSDGIPGNAQPLNAAVEGSPARKAILTIKKGAEADRLAAARDAMLWVEYELL